MGLIASDCRLLATDSNPVQKTLQQLSSNIGQYGHIMYSDDPPPKDGIPAPDDPDAVLTQGKGALVRTNVKDRDWTQAAISCGFARELCAVLAQAALALVPALVTVPACCHDLAAVARLHRSPLCSRCC